MLSLLQSPRQKLLLKILQFNQILTIRELSQRMAISDSTLRRELRPFLEAGIPSETLPHFLGISRNHRQSVGQAKTGIRG